MTRSSYEVHLASDIISLRLDEAIRDAGFVRDRFVGGTTGVVHPCHYTADPKSSDALTDLWHRSMTLLRGAGPEEFHGYAEGEVTSPRHRVPIVWQPFSAGLRFPYSRFAYEDCPPGHNKKFDVHVTADLRTIDERFRQLMEEDCNFHFVDIDKPGGAKVRVYTIQPFGSRISARIWKPLLSFFQSVGGFEGKIKLEVCRYFERFPANAACCPVVVEINRTAAA